MGLTQSFNVEGGTGGYHVHGVRRQSALLNERDRLLADKILDPKLHFYFILL